MPPEQLVAIGPDQMAETAGLDARSDLFSLGVMLYELLTGQHPFGPLALQLTPEEARALLLARQQTGARPVRQLNPEVDPTLARLVQRCLAYEPAARPQRAAELAGALRRRQSGLQRARRWVGRNVWLTAAAVLFFLGITGAALALWPQPEPEVARLWRLGKEAYAAGNYQAAIDHFDKLDALEPGQVDLWKARGRSYQKWGESTGDTLKFNQAVNDYFRVLEVAPKDGATHACRGYCLLRLKIASAKGNLEAAAKYGVDSAENFNNLGYFWIDYGANYDKAFANLTEAIQRNKDLQAAYYNRARAHLRVVEGKGGSKNPGKSGSLTQKKQENARVFAAHLTIAKEDIRRAVELAKDQAPADLLLHAAIIWAISSDYYPGDLPAALGYLKVALAKGLDVKDVPAVIANVIPRGSPDLQVLLDNAVAARNQPGYVAPRALPPVALMVDPLRD
jgi:tetratricopeptide (TPR) repeat protein